MPRTVGIGIQDYSKIRENDYFYIDKSDFIKEWWENGDDVTLITRPRRFGKTLTMSITCRTRTLLPRLCTGAAGGFGKPVYHYFKQGKRIRKV